MFVNVWIVKGASEMQSEKEYLDEVFRLVLEASSKLWEAVVAIHEHETALSKSFVQPIMQMRGEMHINFLRPMYKKFPELATKYGLDGNP